MDREGCNQLAYDLMMGLPAEPQANYEIVLCAPYIFLDRMDKFFQKTPFFTGAQDCSSRDNGAFTGDISAAMLKDMGCSFVILGHSERRQYHNETDEIVAAKAIKAYAAKLAAIICVGETAEDRENGREKDIVARQLAHSIPQNAPPELTVIAYEPVWAIGTGKTASADDVRDMHAFIREKLPENLKTCRILYGGSMKPDNARELLAVPNVDGGLIGGASLKAADFISIAKSA